MAVSESVSSRGGLFGIPLAKMGLFSSLLMAIAFGCVVFFATCFIAIVSLLFYNEAGHHAVDMADAYRYVAFPAGLIALVAGLAVMVGLWLRGKLSGN
jgi:hypothetical protein